MSNFDLNTPSVNTGLIYILDGLGRHLEGEAQVQLQKAIAVIQEQEAEISTWKQHYTSAKVEVAAWQQQCKDATTEMWKVTRELGKVKVETEEVKAEIAKQETSANLQITTWRQQCWDAHTEITTLREYNLRATHELSDLYKEWGSFRQALADCRDVFPAPEEDSDLAEVWVQSMIAPENTVRYIEKSADALEAEVTRCKQNASFWCNAATSHLQERNEAYTALVAANDFINTSIPPANSGSVLEWNQWCDKQKKVKKLIDAVLNSQEF